MYIILYLKYLYYIIYIYYKINYVQINKFFFFTITLFISYYFLQVVK